MVDWSKRFLTGIIVVPCIFLFVRYRFAFLVLSHVIVYLIQTEYAKIVNLILKMNSGQAEHGYLDSMQSVLAILPGHLFFLLVSFMKHDGNIHLALFMSVIIFCFVRIFNFISYGSFLTEKKEIREKDSYLDRRFYILTFLQLCGDLFGFLLFVYPLSFMIFISNLDHGIGYVLIWLIATWQTDNGALFLGAMVGKTPFLRMLSAKKTWEGVSGGIFLSVITGLLLFTQKNRLETLLPDIALKHYLIISLLVSIISIFGDAIESFVKRAANVKDSSDIFPGHGGVLDRMDSLSFSAPIVYFYAKIICGF